MTIRKEIASGLALFLFGAGLLVYDLKYPLDTWANPGPGVFPLIVGVALVILAGRQVVQGLRKYKSQETEEKLQERTRSLAGFYSKNMSETKALIMIGVFIIYLIMVKWVGFFISTFVFVIVSSRLMGALNWSGPVVLSLGIDFFCYCLFEIWLKLSFPRGILF